MLCVGPVNEQSGERQRLSLRAARTGRVGGGWGGESAFTKPGHGMELKEVVANRCARRSPEWVGWWVLSGGRVSRAMEEALMPTGAGQLSSRPWLQVPLLGMITALTEGVPAENKAGMCQD